MFCFLQFAKKLPLRSQFHLHLYLRKIRARMQMIRGKAPTCRTRAIVINLHLLLKVSVVVAKFCVIWKETFSCHLSFSIRLEYIKSRGLLIFSEGVESKQWHKMGQESTYETKKYRE